MKRITKLTKEQESKIPEYISKWVNNASAPLDKEKAAYWTKELYKSMGKKEPIIIFGDSPWNCCNLAWLFLLLYNTKHNIKQLYSQLGSQLYSQLPAIFKEQLKIVYKATYVIIYWSVWCGWYEYGQYIGAKLNKKAYDLFVNFCEQVHFIIPFDDICFISEKPKVIHWNSNKQLHKDGGLAVEYADNWGVYALNGVRVPEYLAVTPSGKLDLEWWKKEKNADVRTEFRNKYGAERMKKLGKVVDSYKNYKNLNPEWKKSKYQLIDMSSIFNEISYAPHLDMVNLTTGTQHLEPVSPECKTIQDAIKFRWEEDPDSYETVTIK